ncbi:MAG: diguanylate cyclase [Eubacteriales bacterium]|nr:diguanylate cyclase [Eubacteriales bacterium]
MQKISTADDVQTLMDHQHLGSFLFHNCIGAAMLLELEGESIRALMINEEFYKVVGRGKDFFEQYDVDLTESILPEDEQDMAEAIRNVLKYGKSKCLMHRQDTNQVFQVTYHHVGADGTKEILFAHVEDITERVDNDLKIQALMTLPGSIVFDYDPINDVMVIRMNRADAQNVIRTERFLKENSTGLWLDPVSEKRVREIYENAVGRACGGYFDFKGRFGTKKFLWHRAYYRSIAGRSGQAFRIVGRIDDIESSAWTGISYDKFKIYDTTTQLLTYQALKEYIAKKLGEEYSGTMLLLELDGMEAFGQELGEERRTEIMREIADRICRLFRHDDIFGSFGEEGFIVFMPQTFSRELACRRAKEIGRVVDEVIQKVEKANVQCLIGISIANQKEITVTDLLMHANTALRRAKESGSSYEMYEATLSDVKAVSYIEPEKEA